MSDGQSRSAASVARTFPNIEEVRSAPGEDTGVPIPPNTERAADATPK